MSNLYRGSSIDASYQVSVHMAEGFQRRGLKCENLTEDKKLKSDVFLILFGDQYFLAHLAKGNVIFCHHLASVVCCLSSVFR
jgi:hypothetical protein